MHYLVRLREKKIGSVIVDSVNFFVFVFQTIMTYVCMYVCMYVFFFQRSSGQVSHAAAHLRASAVHPGGSELQGGPHELLREDALRSRVVAEEARC